MGTVLQGNTLNINGIQIEASDTNGYKQISFKDTSNLDGKMKFSGAKVSFLEHVVNQSGNLSLDVSNEHHIVNASFNIENITFTNLDQGTSGLIVIKNLKDLLHGVNFSTIPDVILMRSFQLKGGIDAFNIIEYTAKDGTLFLQLI